MISEDYLLVDLSESQGRNEGRCYCGKGKKNVVNCGITFQNLTPEMFDGMRNRGFYRYGSFVRAPDAYNSCCSQFQFKIDALTFEPRKSHRKVLRRWEQFLNGERDEEHNLLKGEEMEEEDGEKRRKSSDFGKNVNTEAAKECDRFKVLVRSNIEKILREVEKEIQGKDGKMVNLVCTKKDKVDVKVDKSNKNMLFANLVQIVFNENQATVESIPKLTEAFIKSHPRIQSFLPKGFKIAANGFINFPLSGSPETMDEEEIKTKKKPEQKNIEKSNKKHQLPVEGKKNNKINIEPVKKKHKFEIKFEEPTFTEAKGRVYCLYQYGDYGYGGTSGLKSMWCYKGVSNKTLTAPNGETLEMGSKHMCFYLDDELVGVSIVDVVSTMICSLYFFYHPKLKIYDFGILSVLKEIEFVQQKTKNFPQFRYQNLGSFQKNNDKMIYKTSFGTGLILCPYSMGFVPLTPEVMQKIEEGDNRLSGEKGKRNLDEEYPEDKQKLVAEVISSDMIVRIKGQIVRYKDMPKQQAEKIIAHYDGIYRALGKTLSKKTLPYLD